MAIRYAVANGNWSNVATWDGGTTLPGAGDDVYADGKTVTIDQDITVLSINTTQRSGGTAGGGFTVAGSFTLNCNVVSGTNACVVSNINSPATLTINGNIYGSMIPYGLGYGVNHLGSGTIYVTGNVTGGSGGASSYTHGLVNGSTGTIYITGNISTNGPAANSYVNSAGVYNAGAGIINISGNINGSNNGGTNWNCGVYNAGNGVINVTNTIITGGTGTRTYGIWNATGGSVNIDGYVVGGSNSSSGIYNAAAGIITVVGNQIVKGSYANIYNAGSGIVNIVGNIYGSISSGVPSNSQYIYNSADGTINITGDVVMQDILITSVIGLIHNTGTGNINVSGSVTAGSALNCIAISNAGTGNIIVTGNVTGGSALNSFGVYSTSNGLIDIAGNVIANASSAIYSIGLSARNLIRNYITNFNKVNAVCAVNIEVSETAGQVLVMQELVNGTDRSFSTTNVAGGLPQVTDVRYGTLYGPINEYTGTCKVPTPDKVLLGNYVDNTVGTLLMSPEDFWNFAQQYITAGIGARLKNCATVETVGEQIVSLNQQ